MDNQHSRLIPVVKWSQYHMWPSIAGLRWLIFNADQNGFNSVVKRVGNRCLICEKSFFDWVERETNKKEEIKNGLY